MEKTGPGPTDPLVRFEPPFVWARTSDLMPRRVETAIPPDLDPDIAMWKTTEVQVWPFAGAPTAGVWPAGWLGVDNTGTLYVCKVAGAPGTWAVVGGGRGGGWPTVNGSGAGHLQAQTAPGDTIGYQMADFGTGGISIQTNNPAGNGVSIADAGGGFTIGETGAGTSIDIATGGGAATTGINLTAQASDTGGLKLVDHGAGGILLNEVGTGAVTIETTGGGATTGITVSTHTADTGGIVLDDEGSGGITIAKAGSTGAINIETVGGGATTGINITTQTTDTAGITIVDSSTHGVSIQATGAADVHLSNQGTGSVNLSTTGGGASNGITLTAQASDVRGITLTDTSGNGISLGTTSPAGLISLSGGNAAIVTTKIILYGGTPVAQPAAIPAPAGGAVIDVQARAAITSILNAIGAAAGGIGITA